MIFSSTNFKLLEANPLILECSNWCTWKIEALALKNIEAEKFFKTKIPSDAILFPPKIPAPKTFRWLLWDSQTRFRPSSFPFLLLLLIPSRRNWEPLHPPSDSSARAHGGSSLAVRSSEAVSSLSFCFQLGLWFSFHWIFMFSLWIAKNEIYLKGGFLVLVWVSVALLWKFLCLEFVGCWCF